MTTVAGTSAFASVVAALEPKWVMGMTGLVAVLGVLQLVFSPADHARTHSQLATDFNHMLSDGIALGEHWKESDCDRLYASMNTLEAGEPMSLRGVVVKCQGQLALEYGETHCMKLGFARDLLADWIDVDPAKAHRTPTPTAPPQSKTAGQ